MGLARRTEQTVGAVTVTTRNRTEPNVPVGATVDRDGVYRPIGTESAALSYADSELANGGSWGSKFPLLLDALSRLGIPKTGQARPGPFASGSFKFAMRYLWS